MRLGHTQRAILTSLASGPRSAVHLAYDWPWITEAGARSAIERLGRRSLVDVAGFDGQARTFKVTDKGLDVLDLEDAE